MTEKTLYLAGGCFWGTERYLSMIPGVIATEVGYANGKQRAVTYQEVCRENTGHAETVKVTFDLSLLSVERLLALFFDAIDPTSVNQQGNDIGTQYRTGVFYDDPSLRPAIDRAMDALQKKTAGIVAAEVLPLSQYCPAEEYHQNYLAKNPDGYCHIGIAQFLHLAAEVKKL